MSGSLQSRGLLLLALLPVLLLASPAAAEQEAEAVALTEEARQLFLQEDVEGAWDLLSAAEDDFAGHPDFDYWLGLVAVRSGRAAEGLFALERVINQQPGHAAARLELVGAYIQLGQFDNAATELDTLEQLSPPRAARRAIDQYRRQIAREDTGEAVRPWMAWVGLELGHDDNPGTWPEEIEFPFFPEETFELDIPDTSYGALLAGVRGQHERDNDHFLAGTLNVYSRHNQEEQAEQFDMDMIQGEGEYGMRLDEARHVSGLVEAGQLWLDGDTYRRHLGLAGQWQHDLDSARSYRVRAGVREQEFDLDQFDHTRWQLSGRYRHQIAPRWQGEAEVTGEYEDADSDRPGGDSLRQILLGRLLFQATAEHRLGADLRHTWTSYDDEDEAQPDDSERRDTALLAGAQWEWSPSPEWLLRARAQYRDQGSNQDFYEFDQTQVSLALSRYF